MMDAAERELFATTVRAATGSATGVELDGALDDIGWTDALAVDRRTTVATVFEAQGAAGATSSALAAVLLDALGIDAPPGTAVVLPRLSHGEPPGSQVHGSADSVRVVGVGLGDLSSAERAVVVATGHGGSLHWTVVDVAQLAPRVVTGLDPALGLVTIDAQVTPGEPWARLDADWDAAIALGRLAVGHELVGAMRTMVDLAREHAVGRVQFGRPIATFQAVRHRLAESLVAVEAADAALDGAWHDGTTLGAAVAKSIAGHRAKEVRRHCQQVLAGIGFTTEHDLHRYVRRTMALDALLGDARTLSHEIGAELIAARRLPSILPL